MSVDQGFATELGPGSPTDLRSEARDTYGDSAAAVDLSSAFDLGCSSPGIFVRPAALDFGAVKVGGQRVISLMVENSGPAPETLKDAAVWGPDASLFRTTAFQSPTFKCGQPYELLVSFNPTSVGKFSADLIIQVVGRSDIQVKLVGTGL